MSSKIVELSEITCAKCGTMFSMEDQLMERRKKDGDSFYCPNGHGNVFTNNTATALKEAEKQIAELKTELSECKAECRSLNCRILNLTRNKEGFFVRFKKLFKP